MSRRLFSILLILCAMLLMLPTTSYAEEESEPKDLVNITITGIKAYDLAHETVALVNEARAEAGIEELTLNATLTELAMRRAAEISVHYAHERPDGSAVETIFENAYTDYTYRAENIATGFTDAATVTEIWINSNGYKENILNSRFTQMGVGCYITGGTTYWVQLFGNSTTNTDVSEITDRIFAPYRARISASELMPRESQYSVVISENETASFQLNYRNPYDQACKASLIPVLTEVTDSDGALIAKLSTHNDGTILVTAVASGYGRITLPVYEGEPSPATLRVAVGNVCDITSTSIGTGTVTLSQEAAAVGDEIKITAVPGERSYVSSVRVVYSDGLSPEDARKHSPIDYSFVVARDCDVAVQVTFSKVHDADAPCLYDHLSPVTLNYIAPGETQFGYTGDTVCADCGTVMQAGQRIPPLDGSYTDIPFTDVVIGEYYEIPVAWAVANKITTGTTDTTFSPDDPCSRGQVVTFLWRSAGEPEPASTDNPFTDISPEDYYYNAVLWAVEKGITKGTSETTFSPNDPCTRGQVAAFLWRFRESPDPEVEENPFSDVLEGEYYHDAVLWAVENEITTGMGNGLFSPALTCTRAQIVTFLYRARN